MSGSAPVNTEWYGHAAFKYLPIPETSQYMPERDEQLLGYDEAIRVAKGYTNMPIAPAPDYVNCAACETTWLVGYQGLESAANHPSHNTLFHHYSWQSRRSMVVRVHGACSDDGATPGKSSMGVFFGPKSSYNTSGILPTPSPTKQTAEILAAISAVRCVRRYIRPKRDEIVLAKEGIHQEDPWSNVWSTPRLERHRNNRVFRLIVVTDSIYLVESLCRKIEGWELGPDGLYRNNRGAHPLTNALFLQLMQEIDALSRDGVDVIDALSSRKLPEPQVNQQTQERSVLHGTSGLQYSQQQPPQQRPSQQQLTAPPFAHQTAFPQQHLRDQLVFHQLQVLKQERQRHTQELQELRRQIEQQRHIELKLREQHRQEQQRKTLQFQEQQQRLQQLQEQLRRVEQQLQSEQQRRIEQQRQMQQVRAQHPQPEQPQTEQPHTEQPHTEQPQTAQPPIQQTQPQRQTLPEYLEGLDALAYVAAERYPIQQPPDQQPAGGFPFNDPPPPSLTGPTRPDFDDEGGRHRVMRTRKRSDGDEAEGMDKRMRRDTFSST
ncbi:hypothetical protein MBLNU13_g06140t2 [Cladosporium sp. NU13]